MTPEVKSRIEDAGGDGQASLHFFPVDEGLQIPFDWNMVLLPR